jgi:catechol 2,3-dioxygenase-like lactoylglutathione lyase family enzyme
MQIVDSYPVIITQELQASRDFYTMWLDFEVVFEASWFVLIKSGSTSLAFMHPNHPSSPPDPPAFAGEGAFLTLQVEDAGAEYERLVGRGLQCALPLRDEPWGQRRFGLLDPVGMWVDIVEQTEPDEGWWDPYLT